MPEAPKESPNGRWARRVAPIALAALFVIASGLPPAARQLAGTDGQEADSPANMDSGKLADWRRRWESNILARARHRYCDTEMGEELAWFFAQFLKGFYYGFEATGDP